MSKNGTMMESQNQFSFTRMTFHAFVQGQERMYLYHNLQLLE